MSIPRYTVTGDGLQDDPHGFLARWYDVEQLQAEVARLTAERDGLAKALAEVRAVVDTHDADPLRVGEPAESIDIGRAQLADEVRAALAALPTAPEQDGTE